MHQVVSCHCPSHTRPYLVVGHSCSLYVLQTLLVRQRAVHVDVVAVGAVASASAELVALRMQRDVSSYADPLARAALVVEHHHNARPLEADPHVLQTCFVLPHQLCGTLAVDLRAVAGCGFAAAAVVETAEEENSG